MYIYIIFNLIPETSDWLSFFDFKFLRSINVCCFEDFRPTLHLKFFESKVKQFEYLLINEDVRFVFK